MLNQREAAEMERDRTELEKKREALKLQVQMHRDKGEEAPIEELEAMTREAAEINGQIEAITEELRTVTKPNPEIGGQIPTMVNEINKDNFRASREYKDAFFRSLINRGISQEDKPLMDLGFHRTITSYDTNGNTTGGAYLVPETTLNDIKSVITQYGKVYSAVTKYNFLGDVSIPIGTHSATTNNADGTDTLAYTFTEVQINQAAIVATISLNNMLIRNGISALESYLVQEIGKYIGLALEDRVLNGVAVTHKFLGIITSIDTADEEYDVMDWATVSAILGAVDSPYGDNGTWVMRRKTFFDQFFSLEDAEGRPLITTAPLLQGRPGLEPYLIAGRPVIFSSKVPANGVLYGDLSTYIVNESQEIVIEVDSSVGFATDTTMFRGKVYAGGSPLFATSTFAYYKKAS